MTTLTLPPRFVDAVAELAPNVSFTYDSKTSEIETWDDPTVQDPDGLGIAQPTKAAINTKLAEMLAEHDALAWSRNREVEYPDMGEQFNKIYDDGLTKWKSEMIDPVKAKWPKDNSGPK